MESRATRAVLASFPPDLAFTKDPKDPLRRFLDVAGRQTTIVSEYIRSQLDNLQIGLADLNDPYLVFTSGVTSSLSATLSGLFVQQLQDMANMEPTGFELVETLYPSGVSTDLRGISYVQDPATSGILYLSAVGDYNVYQYNWNTVDQLVGTQTFGVATQSFNATGKDEYLVIDKAGDGTIKATIDHVPLSGVTVIDTKNLVAPWDPLNSDGIVVHGSEITISGNTLFLESPRPSYNPAIVNGNSISYPVNYQPDLNWDSSFIVEYNYVRQLPAYGLSQPAVSHEMGVRGTPIGGSENP